MTATGAILPYVDFYREEEISLVAQDISDLGRHFFGEWFGQRQQYLSFIRNADPIYAGGQRPNPCRTDRPLP